MILIDTHTHLYLEEFDTDRAETVQRAVNADVQYMLLPDIDKSHSDKLLSVCHAFPQHCFAMAGIHPTSVKPDFQEELEHLKKCLDKNKYFAIGEIGIDLYWDKTYFNEQCTVFREQLNLAINYDLPVAIHSRNSLNEIIQILNEPKYNNIKGVFHCFPGSVQQAEYLINKGFFLGIGGVVTYKNSGMAKVVEKFGLSNIILETDAPYLPPVPHRGKRNEPAYVREIAQFIAQLIQSDEKQVAEITTKNASDLFKLNIL